MELIVEVSNHFLRDFKFKIADNSYMERPCFRFDSDGKTHHNSGDIPLQERAVTPPHFHRFNKDGEEYAYKSELLKTHEAKILSDRQFALLHFADEEHIELEQIPVISVLGQLIPPENKLFDPLEGEQFS